MFVCPSVPCYFQTTITAIFEGKNSPNDIIINHKMTEDEAVAFDGPPRYLLIFCMNLPLKGMRRNFESMMSRFRETITVTGTVLLDRHGRSLQGEN